MTYRSRTGALVVEVPVPAGNSWPGWTFTAGGRFLRSPDGQHITQERLEGLLWRDAMELRRAGLQSRRKAAQAVRRGSTVKVLVVDLADWQARHFGRRAG